MPRVIPDEIVDTIDDSQLEVQLFSPTCATCLNLDEDGERSCTAFALIPEAIWSGKDNHRKPYAGDHGVTFTPHPRRRST